tara:strand:+ start:918 stop:1979 length:1062 start_codon:yes stop_codon:yes gene_type:complete
MPSFIPPGLNSNEVWDKNKAFDYLLIQNVINSKRYIEQKLNSIDFFPQKINKKNLTDEFGRNPNISDLNYELRKNEIKKNLILFMQIHSFSAKKIFLHSNDFKGNRFWVKISGNMNNKNLIDAIRKIQKYLNKPILIIPSKNLVKYFRKSRIEKNIKILTSFFQPINISTQFLSISSEDRKKLSGHCGKVIWFTGLSGSGKSTLANALEIKLYGSGMRTYILDGDNIRLGLNKDLGFTKKDRIENIRRIAEVSKLMMDAGIIVITAFISPFRSERLMAKDLIGGENFFEIFVNTPLSICEKRDTKGLYQKARKGLIKNMTGISSPYEKPINPIFETNNKSIEKCVKEILKLVF